MKKAKRDEEEEKEREAECGKFISGIETPVYTDSSSVSFFSALSPCPPYIYQKLLVAKFVRKFLRKALRAAFLIKHILSKHVSRLHF